jgi:hypothetical protein
MRCSILLAGLAFLATSSVAAAQDAPLRRGFWLSLGAGIGSHGVSCGSCIGGTPREGGVTTTFRAGGALSPRVSLGVDLAAWLKPLDDPGRGEYAFLGALMGEAQLYLKPESGLFLLGGAGYIVDVVDDDLVLDTPGIVLGTGIDIPLGRGGFSITPHLKYFRTVDGGNLTSSLYQFVLAATWP